MVTCRAEGKGHTTRSRQTGPSSPSAPASEISEEQPRPAGPGHRRGLCFLEAWRARAQGARPGCDSQAPALTGCVLLTRVLPPLNLLFLACTQRPLSPTGCEEQRRKARQVPREAASQSPSVLTTVLVRRDPSSFLTCQPFWRKCDSPHR